MRLILPGHMCLASRTTSGVEVEAVVELFGAAKLLFFDWFFKKMCLEGRRFLTRTALFL